MRTFFQDFVRDNGLPITVEYSATGGEPNFDFPGHVCDGGGSGPDIVILNAWPDTPRHNRLAKIQIWSITRPNVTRAGAWLARKLTAPVRGLMLLDEWWSASLTDAERDRMETWLAEHYVEEPWEEE
jgi:hypothetical protein